MAWKCTRILFWRICILTYSIAVILVFMSLLGPSLIVDSVKWKPVIQSRLLWLMKTIFHTREHLIMHVHLNLQFQLLHVQLLITEWQLVQCTVFIKASDVTCGTINVVVSDQFQWPFVQYLCLPFRYGTGNGWSNLITSLMTNCNTKTQLDEVRSVF